VHVREFQRLLSAGGVMERNARTLAAMLDALAELGAPHALFGGLLTGYYGQYRATGDVDLLVSRRFIEPLEGALVRRGYAARHFRYLMKLYAPGDSAAVGDFVVYETNAVLRAAFAATMPAEILGLRVSVVRRGVFVALKFESSISQRRSSKDKALDVIDARRVVEQGFGPEDVRLAVEIAGTMYRGAVADFESFLDDLRRGRWPRVVTRAETQTALLVRRGLAPLRPSRVHRIR
jgi:hypothetical protein